MVPYQRQPENEKPDFESSGFNHQSDDETISIRGKQLTEESAWCVKKIVVESPFRIDCSKDFDLIVNKLAFLCSDDDTLSKEKIFNIKRLATIYSQEFKILNNLKEGSLTEEKKEASSDMYKTWQSLSQHFLKLRDDIGFVLDRVSQNQSEEAAILRSLFEGYDIDLKQSLRSIEKKSSYYLPNSAAEEGCDLQEVLQFSMPAVNTSYTIPTIFPKYLTCTLFSHICEAVNNFNNEVVSTATKKLDVSEFQTILSDDKFESTSFGQMYKTCDCDCIRNITLDEVGLVIYSIPLAPGLCHMWANSIAEFNNGISNQLSDSLLPIRNLLRELGGDIVLQVNSNDYLNVNMFFPTDKQAKRLPFVPDSRMSDGFATAEKKYRQYKMFPFHLRCDFSDNPYPIKVKFLSNSLKSPTKRRRIVADLESVKNLGIEEPINTIVFDTIPVVDGKNIRTVSLIFKEGDEDGIIDKKSFIRISSKALQDPGIADRLKNLKNRYAISVFDLCCQDNLCDIEQTRNTLDYVDILIARAKSTVGEDGKFLLKTFKFDDNIFYSVCDQNGEQIASACFNEDGDLLAERCIDPSDVQEVLTFIRGALGIQPFSITEFSGYRGDIVVPRKFRIDKDMSSPAVLSNIIMNLDNYNIRFDDHMLGVLSDIMSEIKDTPMNGVLSFLGLETDNLQRFYQHLQFIIRRDLNIEIYDSKDSYTYIGLKDQPIPLP